ncbi:MAG: ABC transporter ATP-binding protein [Symploca sp. SIO1C2]|nr:ABC transporter ATP-binding protein [Symploca sp. SIO1C2]
MNNTKHKQIQVHGLQVCLDGKAILHGVDLTLKRGEFVSLVGQSGSGKSTLLHALAGFIEKEGEVWVPKDLGIVFQNYAVFPWLTVRGNIAFGLHKINRHEREAIITNHLELVGLAEQAHKYPAQLSGGQNQRVALARALAPNPELILMDEPFGALDMYTREKMQTWLLDVWEQNQKTVLFVTHNIEEALFLSDRVLILGGGLIIGEFASPFARPRTEALKFTPPFIELKRQVLELIQYG